MSLGSPNFREEPKVLNQIKKSMRFIILDYDMKLLSFPAFESFRWACIPNILFDTMTLTNKYHLNLVRTPCIQMVCRVVA